MKTEGKIVILISSFGYSKMSSWVESATYTYCLQIMILWILKSNKTSQLHPSCLPWTRGMDQMCKLQQFVRCPKGVPSTFMPMPEYNIKNSA